MRTMKWYLLILILVSVSIVTTIADTASAQARSGDLVLWNRLGSQSEIENSEIGLDGTYGGGDFVEGVFGQAYQVDYDDTDYLVTFPKEVVTPFAGCIEFWARIQDLPEQIGVAEARPIFFKLRDGIVSYLVGFNANDGCGNGGLVGQAGHDITTGSGGAGAWRYDQVLGEGQVEAWHHYALVWDEMTIAGVDDGTRRIALFLDGELESGRWREWHNPYFADITGGQLEILALYDGFGAGSVAIDNLKIWNYAKTTFCDRFVENPGQIWHVPGDAPTIQAGIDAASAGDIVCVACGTYDEHDIAMKSGVILTSETGRAGCVTIDAQQQGPVLICDSVNSTTAICGLILTGGLNDTGGGIRCLSSQPMITDCALTDNVADIGGGLYCDSCTPVLDGCTLYANSASDGAGIYARNSPLKLNRTLVAFNEGPSISCQGQAPDLACCDLYGNSGGDWVGLFADQVIERGNFAANPCFCDAGTGNLTLCADSFCLPDNHPWGCNSLVGAFGEGCAACDCTGPVSSFLSMFDIRVDRGSVTVVWQTVDGTDGEHYRLTASRNGQHWEVPHNMTAAGAFTATDDSPRLATGGPITYSLYYRSETDPWLLLQSRAVDLQPSLSPTRLTGAYPNPFNPVTNISFIVHQSQRVKISVFNVAGMRVAELTDQVYGVGFHSVAWDGVDTEGRDAPSGLYWVRMAARDNDDSRKISLVR